MTLPTPRIVLGLQCAREAIAVHGASLHRVLVEARPREAHQIEAVARFATDRGARVDRVGRDVLDRLAQGERHQGVVVEAPPLKLSSIEDVVDHLRALASGAPAPFVVALDEVTDPHNFGAIVRSAVGFGASAVLWPEDKSAPLSGAMMRASAGAVEYARLCRVAHLGRALTELSTAGLVTVGLDASADATLDTFDLNQPVCLVIGSEGKGLRGSTKRACQHIARLPMPGPIASLNASVAAGASLYEVVRQRNPSPARQLHHANRHV